MFLLLYIASLQLLCTRTNWMHIDIGEIFNGHVLTKSSTTTICFEEKQQTIKIPKELLFKLNDNIKSLQETTTTWIKRQKEIFESEKSWYNRQSNNKYKIVPPSTFQSTLLTCQKHNGTLIEIVDDHALSDLNQFFSDVKSKGGLSSIEGIWEIWTNINSERSPYFSDSNKPVPLMLNDNEVKVELTNLDNSTFCPTYNFQRNTFSTKNCTEELPTVCVGLTKPLDLLTLITDYYQFHHASADILTTSDQLKDIWKNLPSSEHQRPSSTDCSNLFNQNDRTIIPFLNEIKVNHLPVSLTSLTGYLRLLNARLSTFAQFLQDRDSSSKPQVIGCFESSGEKYTIKNKQLFKTDTAFIIEATALSKCEQTVINEVLPINYNQSDTIHGHFILSIENQTCFYSPNTNITLHSSLQSDENCIKFLKRENYHNKAKNFKNFTLKSNNSVTISSDKVFSINSSCSSDLIWTTAAFFMSNLSHGCRLSSPENLFITTFGHLKLFNNDGTTSYYSYEKDSTTIDSFVNMILPYVALSAGCATVITLIITIYLCIRRLSTTTEPAAQIAQNQPAQVQELQVIRPILRNNFRPAIAYSSSDSESD